MNGKKTVVKVLAGGLLLHLAAVAAYSWSFDDTLRGLLGGVPVPLAARLADGFADLIWFPGRLIPGYYEDWVLLLVGFVNATAWFGALYLALRSLRSQLSRNGAGAAEQEATGR